MKIACLLATASVAGLSAIAGAAQAQTVDEIIVTAQKRSQSLQDVPIVVTAVSGQLLQVLPDQQLAEGAIWSLYPHFAFVPAKVRIFRDFVRKRFSGKLELRAR